MNKKNKIILNSFKKSLIASCQPVPRGPLDKPSFVLASAKASIIGGAKALRIEAVYYTHLTLPTICRV